MVMKEYDVKGKISPQEIIKALEKEYKVDYVRRYKGHENLDITNLENGPMLEIVSKDKGNRRELTSYIEFIGGIKESEKAYLCLQKIFKSKSASLVESK